MNRFAALEELAEGGEEEQELEDCVDASVLNVTEQPCTGQAHLRSKIDHCAISDYHSKAPLSIYPRSKPSNHSINPKLNTKTNQLNGGQVTNIEKTVSTLGCSGKLLQAQDDTNVLIDTGSSITCIS